MSRLARTAVIGLMAWVASAGATWAAEHDLVETLKKRGYLNCGVTDSQFSFAGVDSGGTWTGFDVDFCRAVAAAVLGDAQRVRFFQLGPAVRFDALARGEVDVLFRNTTWTYERDTWAGFDFAGVTFYDAQGFLVHRDTGYDRVADAPAGTRICVVRNTTTVENLTEFIDANDLDLEVVGFDTFEGGHKAFFSGQCALYTSDVSALLSMRAHFPPRPEEYKILADRISKEPLGPMVRNDDPRWFDLVKWVVQATIAAEEHGITMANVDVLGRTATNPEVRRMLGIDPGVGAPLGLDDGWIERIVSQVGNYGEIYDRSAGPGTGMGLERGLNALWRDGGLMYALPFH